MITKKQIVEVPFYLPGGVCKHHPALIVSDLIEEEDGKFFYAVLVSSRNLNPKYTVEITPEMLNIPLGKQSYFVTHLLDRFDVSEVISDRGCFIKDEYFEKVIVKVFRNIFGYDLEFD